MLEKIVDQFNCILQKAWFGNFFFHGISDLLYNIACFGYKLIARPTKEQLRTAAEKMGRAETEKEIRKMSRKMRRAWFIDGILPQEYVGFHFEDRDKKERSSFLSVVDGAKYCTILTDLNYYHIFRNKYETYLAYKDWYKREVIQASDIDEGFITRHPTFMFKPVSSHKGVACKCICAADYPDLDAIKASVPDWDQGICEEMIEQDPWTARFHPSSVNSVRIQTLLRKDGKVMIFGAFLRTGRGTSFVDNSFAGGPFADIDVKTGIIDSPGCDEWGHVFPRHPESNLVFEGTQIPQWKELCQTSRQLAHVTPKVKVMSWDMALTEQGWVMVEGNPFGEFAQQYATQKGLKKKLQTCTKLCD